MERWINATVTAAVLLILGMAIADFITTGHFDPIATSAAICAPILSAALHRWATKPYPRKTASRR